jgi:hypothetical protein
MQRKINLELIETRKALGEIAKSICNETPIEQIPPAVNGPRLFLITNFNRTISLTRSNFFISFAPLLCERLISYKIPPRLLTKPLTLQSDSLLFRMGISVPVKATTESNFLHFRRHDESSSKALGFSNSFVSFQFTDSTEYFDLSDITHIIRCNDIVEIVANRRSVALKSNKFIFDKAVLEPSLSNLKFDVRSPDKLIDLKYKYQDKWLAGELTTLKYLLVLNALSGRCFHTPQLRPILPALDTAFSNCPVQFDNRLIIDPEFYFSPGEYGTPAVIYHNRQQLEARSDIHFWINCIFGAKRSPHHRLFETHEPRSIRKLSLYDRHSVRLHDSDKLLFAQSIGKGMFGIVFDSGQVSFLNVYFSEKVKSFSLKSKIVKSYSIRPLTHTARFFTAKSQIVIDDESSITFLTPAKKMVVPQSASRIWNWSDGIVQLSDWDLAIVQTNGEFKPLITVIERIVCFGSSRRFNITAVACVDCCVRLRLNSNGSKIETITLENNFPERVVITNGWGFVVVKCVETIFVFTANGLPFQKVPYGTIHNWFFFQDAKAADFVAVASVDGKVRLGSLENL